MHRQEETRLCKIVIRIEVTDLWTIWIILFFFYLDYCCCGPDTKSFVFLLQRTAPPVSVFHHDYQLPFPKGEEWHGADQCCLSPEKVFSIWAKPGRFQQVSCNKLPAVLSQNLFKALVTGRILLSLGTYALHDRVETWVWEEAVME